MTDIETLRRAASLMRERAKAATSGPWEFRPRRGFESVSDSPATIGFNDTAGYFVMLREGTWVTEGDMGYIASWHPAVALAVADWLDGTRCVFGCASNGRRFPHCSACSDSTYDHDCPDSVPCEHDAAYHRALAVARTYLGSDQ